MPQEQRLLYKTRFQVCRTLLQKCLQSQVQCLQFKVFPCRGPMWDLCLLRLSSWMGRILMLEHLSPHDLRYCLMKSSYHVSPLSVSAHSIYRCKLALCKCAVYAL